MRQRVSASGMTKEKRAFPEASVRRDGAQNAVSTSSRRGRSSTLTRRSLTAPGSGAPFAREDARS
jgi:hypothetical protein